MAILIVHLSDIHFTVDPLLEQAGMVSAAVCSLVDPTITHAVIMVSGDIAYHGTADEYGTASDFFLTIVEDIKRRQKDLKVSCLMVPGNHDCNLSNPSSVRDILIGHAKDATTIQRDVIDELLSVQRDCRAFISDIESIGDSKLNANTTLLSRLVTIDTLDDVEFLLINSAWMSMIHEQQGTLRIPIDEILHPTKKHVVAMLHHPSNWLESNNARLLRVRLEASSSLILTGHEHTPVASSIRNDRGDEFLHFEGGLFHGKDAVESEFYAIILDLERGYRRFCFRRTGDMYEYIKSSDWEVLPLNSKRQTESFSFTAAFADFLSDIAMPINHGTVANVTLRDIFVWPDLECISLDSTDTSLLRKSRLVRGSDVKEVLIGDGLTLVSGEEKSGKTALAKMLILAAKEKGLAPVYILGTKNIRDYESLKKFILDGVDEIYQGAIRQRFEQLEVTQKCIIIDDVHAIPLAKYPTIIRDLQSFSSRVVLFASGIAAGMISVARPATLTLAHYRIKPFGHLNRNSLVQNWLTLSTVENPGALARKLHEITRRVDDLLGRSYVPAYPIFVIAMLSASEASLPLDNRISTSAYYYEVLIKGELLREKTQYTDLYIGLLSFLAYELYLRGVEHVSLSEFLDISQKYKETMDLRFDSNQMLEQIISRRMILQRNDVIQFRYDFIYLYFVAAYLTGKIHRPEIQRHIVKIVGKLTHARNVDILLFLAHLSNAPFIIDQLQQTVRDVFSSVEQISMQGDLPSIQYAALADVVYAETDPIEARLARARMLDDNDTNEAGYSENSDSDSEDSELSELFGPLNAVTISFRSIELLGQVLKNYPGQLDADVKYAIGQGIMHAGLRTLKWTIDYIDKMKQEIASELIELTKERDKFFDQSSARLLIEEALTRLIYFVCVGFIKRTALSIGSRELEVTYEKIVRVDGTIPVKLIHAAILLDCSSTMPEALVERYRKDMAHHQLSLSILRDLVIEHFYLFEVDRITKQRVCQALGIRYRDALRLSDGK